MILDFYKKNKKATIIILVIIIFALGAWHDHYMKDTWAYRKIMKEVIAKKLADKNPNPVFDGIQEPPLPSEDEIMDDPIGPDRNKNGIRDDIDIFINRSADDYNIRMAIRQKARATQSLIIATINKDDLNATELANDSFKATYCIEFILKSSDLEMKYKSLRGNIQNLSVIPNSRTKNKIDFSNSIEYLDAGAQIGEEYELCSFDIKNRIKMIEQFKLNRLRSRDR